MLSYRQSKAGSKCDAYSWQLDLGKAGIGLRPCAGRQPALAGEGGAGRGAGHKKRAGAIASAITPAHPKMAATYSPTFAVPSAQLGLTSLFGMGRGGTPTL